MKLKCIGCIFNNPRGVRNAVTILNGQALCDVCLRKIVLESKRQAMKAQEKKVETTSKDNQKETPKVPASSGVTPAKLEPNKPTEMLMSPRTG